MVENSHTTYEVSVSLFEVRQYLVELISLVEKLCTGVYGVCAWIIKGV